MSCWYAGPQTGDGAARAELFRRHRSDSYRLAYRHLGHEQDALDVVQEAMLKAFSALGDFDGRSGFRTWLLKIVLQHGVRLGAAAQAAAQLPGRRLPARTNSREPTVERRSRHAGSTGKTSGRPSTRPWTA